MKKEKNKSTSVYRIKNQDFDELKEWKNKEYKKIYSDLEVLLKFQKTNYKDLELKFMKLTTQNKELLNQNQKISQQLGKIDKELYILTKEQKEKANRKKVYRNLKGLSKRQSITPEIYQLLIQAVKGSTYTSVRLRIIFCLLTVMGIRINELLPLKVFHLQTLRKYSLIEIKDPKQEHYNHKAFLTDEGKKLIDERQKDFELLFRNKNPDSYVFTSESNHYQMLTRETITRNINKILRSVSKNLPDQLNITSHSFRIGYISKLWEDTNDIKFIKQSIRHNILDTTSAYVNKLSDKNDKSVSSTKLDVE